MTERSTRLTFSRNIFIVIEKRNEEFHVSRHYTIRRKGGGMRIVMFTDAYWPRVNGVTVAVDTFARALQNLGHDVMIVCSQYPEAFTSGEIGADGEKPLKVLRVSSHGLFFSKEDRMAKVYLGPWVYHQVRKFNPDVIHVHSEFIMFTFGSMCASLARLPLVYTFHTLWEDYIPSYSHVMPHLPLFFPMLAIRIIRKAIFQQATVITAPTAQMLDMLHKRWRVKQPVYLLPTGIDGRIFDHTEEEKVEFRHRLYTQFPQLEGRRILLFAGRVTVEKNLDFLLDIAPDVIERHPEAVFVIAGNGPAFYAYQERAAALPEPAAHSVVFTDYLNRKTLALMYAVSSVFVFPSLTETQGLVTIEAMLSGVPVVAIGAKGTINVMGNGSTDEDCAGGFMVKNDRAAFMRRLFDLLEDDDLYRRKSENARVYAQSWTIEPQAKKLVTIYAEAREKKGI